MAAFVLGFLYRQFFLYPTYPTADCSGKTFIVTGANVGLGKEAARHFVRLGAEKVILACRSTDKGEAARTDIETTTKRTGVVEVWSLNLESYDNVKVFAKRVEGLERIDGVIENAGMATSKFRTAGGNESTITVNVVSTFLLALLILPKLKAVGAKYKFTPTLSIVSSELHGLAALPEAKQPSLFDALNDEKTADMSGRYPVSKLLEVLALQEIAREHPASQLGVTVNTLNPGFCESELAREMVSVGMRLMKFFLARTTEVGSRTLVHAYLQGNATHGKYLSDCRVTPVGGVAASRDVAEVQRKVWSELSAKLETIQPGVTKALDG